MCREYGGDFVRARTSAVGWNDVLEGRITEIGGRKGGPWSVSGLKLSGRHISLWETTNNTVKNDVGRVCSYVIRSHDLKFSQC